MSDSYRGRAFAQVCLGLLCAVSDAAPVRKPVAISGHALPSTLEVELTHALGAEADDALHRLVERFNAQSPDGKVVIAPRLWSQGGLPTMAIIPKKDEAQYLGGKSRFKPLWRLEQETGVRLDASSASKPTEAAKRLNALPVALSSPVLFYNEALFERLGVTTAEIPKTWKSWINVLGRVHTEGVACPMTASQPVSTLFENAAVWNNQPLITAGKPARYQGNGLIHVKHMAMMSSWRKSGYFYYFGGGNEGEARFVSGVCGTLLAPSSAYPTLARQAGFKVGIAPYPYHDDAYGAPSRTLADGPLLWVASNRTKAEYKLVARFIQYWLQIDNQMDWLVHAGYLPLNRAGVSAVTGSTLLSEGLAATRQALRQVGNDPVVGMAAAGTVLNRAEVQLILAEEIEHVFEDRKPPKQALDDATLRIRSELEAGGKPRHP
jgi:sn-glycerol 3-phosphate transport system substrate-binding protein